MQKEEYLIKNACYSVTKYYLCKRNNKRSFFSSKQRHKAFRSFPNRYQFSCINKVTSLFSISCILIIILACKRGAFALPNNGYCKVLKYRKLHGLVCLKNVYIVAVLKMLGFCFSWYG